MNLKKTVICVWLIVLNNLYAGITSHRLVSITEQKVMGHIFKHVMTSGNIQYDEFFKDGKSIAEELYYQELEIAQKQEWQMEQARQESERRSRLVFVDTTQVQIASKLLDTLLQQIKQLFNRIENPALESFFIFHKNSIESFDQLMQLKVFVQQLQSSIDQKVENRDFDGLYLLFSKLEFWPDRLEKFFQDSVQNAIKKSDDTAMLKELLQLVSQIPVNL